MPFSGAKPSFKPQRLLMDVFGDRMSDMPAARDLDVQIAPDGFDRCVRGRRSRSRRMIGAAILVVLTAISVDLTISGPALFREFIPCDIFLVACFAGIFWVLDWTPVLYTDERMKWFANSTPPRGDSSSTNAGKIAVSPARETRLALLR